jgi:hypothetical protein
VTIASRNERVPRFSVYQLGRGNDPVIVVGRTLSAVAFSMSPFSWKPGHYTVRLRSARSPEKRSHKAQGTRLKAQLNALLCLTLFGGWQRLPSAVETHGSVERWAAFAVGFLLTAAVLLVLF